MAGDAALRDFALGTFSVAGGIPFAGIVTGERVIAVRAANAHVDALGGGILGADTVLGVLDHWPTNFPVLRRFADATRSGPLAERLQALSAPLDQLRVHPPVERPRNVFCAGMNYRKHVIDLIMSQSAKAAEPGKSDAERRAEAERTMDVRAASGEPFVFQKATSAVVGPFDDVPLPDGIARPDWELELAAVIGRPARHVTRAEALGCVAGYAVANDVTARDRVPHKEMRFDWLKGKSQPGFLPFGPYLVPAAFVPDPQDLHLTLKLNGDVMQDETTADMLFGVARQIEYLSAHVQLLPGDVIATGSPAGNGAHHNRFLRPGDVMEASITGLGTQRNRCAAEAHA
ncbi:MAG TPA: fumarylacetoacetate hydrolase family protein [Hyphomicrobiales bacterium]|nr:fumarylacetoacetate hydrolase family protein [Hyphomicrobiales bacterium]